MRKKLKPIPRFKNEAEERTFWETHDSTAYLDWSQAQRARFPNLKPSTQAIFLRLPQSLLDQIKVEANKRDVPYQSLIKVWLAEKAEHSRSAGNCFRARVGGRGACSPVER
jgi:predicted DNA binding CopG/RHH family protein